MARKKETGMEEFERIIYTCIKGILYLFQSLIEGIITIVALIAKLGDYIDKKERKKERINGITNITFNNTTTTNSTNNTIKQDLNIFDKSIYDNQFSPQIRARGERYFDQNKITNYESNNNNYNCIITGTNNYKTSLTLDQNNNITNMNCTCPYYQDKNNNCKHIYALLYKIKCSNNKKIIKKEIEKYNQNIEKLVTKAYNHMLNNSTKYKDKDITKVYYYYNDYKKYTSENTYYQNNYILEDKLLEILINTINLSNELRYNIEKILKKEKIDSYPSLDTIEEINNNPNRIRLIDVFDDKYPRTYKRKHKKIRYKYTKQELDNYGLEDWQQDLVNKGEYEPYNFEEEDLEDDDYYFEDEK